MRSRIIPLFPSSPECKPSFSPLEERAKWDVALPACLGGVGLGFGYKQSAKDGCSQTKPTPKTTDLQPNSPCGCAAINFQNASSLRKERITLKKSGDKQLSRPLHFNSGPEGYFPPQKRRDRRVKMHLKPTLVWQSDFFQLSCSLTVRASPSNCTLLLLEVTGCTGHVENYVFPSERDKAGGLNPAVKEINHMQQLFRNQGQSVQQLYLIFKVVHPWQTGQMGTMGY